MKAVPMTVTIINIATLKPELARALRSLASNACPSTFKPAAVALVGATDVAEVLGAGRVCAFWTIEGGCADSFLKSPMVRCYVNESVPIVCVVEQVADAQRICAALGRAGAA